MSNETLGPIGWFGKLPAAGDFLRQGLPDNFVDTWDQWLQAGMASGARQLGDNWAEQFLRFPVWYFFRSVAPTGSAQGDDALFAGVLVPSTDRVGRLFPLTVAFTMPSNALMEFDLAAIEDRLADLEEHVLDVLGDDDMMRFEQALNDMPSLAALHQSGDGAQSTPLALACQLGGQALHERVTGHTLFWLGNAAPKPMLLLEPEPLQPEAFCRLVLPFPIPELSE